MNPRKLLLALLALGIGSVVAFNLTSALFSDVETNQSNAFTAGTLDMDVDGNNGTLFQNIVIDNVGVDGTVSGQKQWVVNNTGTIPGNLTIDLVNLDNLENGCNEPEALVDTTCGDPGSQEGELGPNVATSIWIDRDGPGTTYDFEQVVSSDLATANENSYLTQWLANAGTVTIPANGGQMYIRMDWATDPGPTRDPNNFDATGGGYGNEIQSDSLNFDLRFQLEQVTPV